MPIRPELRKLYPENWSEITDRIRFKRAGGSCERCGAQHGQPHPETGKVEYLSTAHLDHDPTNNAEENLAALCRICHNRNDSKNRAANRKHNAYRDAGQLRLQLPEIELHDYRNGETRAAATRRSDYEP